MQRHRTARSAIALLAVFGPWLPAQCGSAWLPGDGYAGTDRTVRALTSWDPDGPGPATALVVVGGEFGVAGSTVASRIATWDPATGVWSPLGSGFDGDVRAAVAMPNGDLVVGGTFATAGGMPAARIARWNGTTWSALGSGVFGGVFSLAVHPSGDLIVGGQFTLAGGAPATSIARWDGSSWWPLGAGLGSGTIGGVYSLVVLPNGDVLAGGGFVGSGFTPTGRLARWDGTSWQAASPTNFNANVNALAVLPNGDWVAGGDFTAPFAGIARWNGATWTSMTPGFVGPSPGPVTSLHLATNGDLFAGFGAGVSRWNGSVWATLGGVGNGAAFAVVTLPGGDLVAGGTFTSIGGTNVSRVARLSNGTWSRMASGMSGGLTHLRGMSDGRVLASAAFTSVPGLGPNGGPAVWDGTSWTGFGPPPPLPLFFARFAGTETGQVFQSGNEPVGLTGDYIGHVYRWFGSFWSELPGATNASILAMETMVDGSVVVGGEFTHIGTSPFSRIARWNGSAWLPLGSGLPGPVALLTGMPNGDVVALHSGNTIARWNGSAWTQLGTVSGFLNLLLAAPNGDLIVGGSFTAVGGMPANHVARWDGSAWTAMGAGLGSPVTCATFLPGGDLVAGGHFTAVGGAGAGRLARWNGTTWSALGNAGLDAAPIGLATDRRGRLVAGGPFVTADGVVSANLAMLASTCPATATASTTGCDGNTLVATALPWVDATFRARGEALPQTALVVAATSFTSIPQGALPLASVFAQAGAGCDLLVAPDILQLHTTTTGSVESSFFLPSAPPIVGLSFFHQHVPFELDLLGNVTQITATNALQLTAGAF